MKHCGCLNVKTSSTGWVLSGWSSMLVLSSGNIRSKWFHTLQAPRYTAQIHRPNIYRPHLLKADQISFSSPNVCSQAFDHWWAKMHNQDILWRCFKYQEVEFSMLHIHGGCVMKYHFKNLFFQILLYWLG